MSSRLAPYLFEDFTFTKAPSVVAWAESNLILPPSMAPAKPGPFSTKQRQYMRPILECWHPSSGVRSLVNVGGSQTGKTAVGAIGSGYRWVHSPMPQLIMGPSEDWLRLEISEKRLMALIEANEVLRNLKPFDSSDYRKMSMKLAGGTVAIEGANSNVATAGSTQGIVWVEEAAKIEHRANEEAPESHPIKLAFERTKEFRGLELHYMSFTPNVSTHVAWQYYQAGTQTHFYMPCPHCGEYFSFEFKVERELKNENKEDLQDVLEASQDEAKPNYYRSLVWSPEARLSSGQWDEDKVIETCRYICPHNGCEISDTDKPGMMDQLEEKHENADASLSNRSFRTPSFYAPRVRFGDMAVEFLKRGDLFTTGLQNFYNSWLALPWEKIIANVKEEAVRALRAMYDYRRRVCHVEPCRLVITADPGERRTHWVVSMIMANEEIFPIDWGTVLSIDDLLDLPSQLKYEIAGTGKSMQPQMGLCDSGEWTMRVYDMCANSRGFWYPSKGSDARVGGWNVTRLKTHMLDLYTYSDYALKAETYVQRILKQKPPLIYLPRDADDAIIMGLSGQELLMNNGQTAFKKLPNDHYGDCVKLTVLVSKVLRAQGVLTNG